MMSDKKMKISTEQSDIVIRIPTDVEGRPSSSGKTIVLASTRGNRAIEVDGKTVMLSINCYQYPDQRK